MRKVLALLLSLLMLTPALAEETVITPLPMGLTDTGYTPDPNAFIAADEENGVLQGYQDDSITVTLWRETVGDATYNIARVKIADPSQFRTGLNHPKARTDNKISAIAEKHNAVVAIGGDYFGKDDYGYVVRMNEVFRKKPSKQRDMLLVDNNGDFHIILQSDADELKALLDDIQQTLFDQAKKFRDEKTHVVHNMEELGAAVENGFAKAMWCGERACEDEIKEKFNASSRNMPFDQEKEWFGDTCVCCGKKAKKVMYFAKAY